MLRVSTLVSFIIMSISIFKTLRGTDIAIASKCAFNQQCRATMHPVPCACVLLFYPLTLSNVLRCTAPEFEFQNANFPASEDAHVHIRLYMHLTTFACCNTSFCCIFTTNLPMRVKKGMSMCKTGTYYTCTLYQIRECRRI